MEENPHLSTNAPHERIKQFVHDQPLLDYIDENIIERYLSRHLKRAREEKQAQAKKTNRVYKISIIVALITATITWDNAVNASKIKGANSAIASYTQWMQQIDNAIKDMREHHEDARMALKYGQKLDLYQFQKERLHLQYAITGAYNGVENAVGQDVHLSNQLLDEFDESVDNLFASDAPSDEAWKLYLDRNNLLIGLKIDKRKQEITRAQTFILVRMFDDFKALFKRT